MDSVRDDIKPLQIEVEWFFVCFFAKFEILQNNRKRDYTRSFFQASYTLLGSPCAPGKSLSQKDKSEKWMVWLPKANVAQVDYYIVQSMRVLDENSHPKTM